MAAILVVDDDALIRTTMRKLLGKVGYTVYEAGTGVEAELVVADHRIDLLITDIIMPEKEGLSLVRELRKRLPQLKIIAMSGGGRSGAFSVLDAAAQFGANAILRKPFRGTELLDAVTAAIGRPPAGSQLAAGG